MSMSESNNDTKRTSDSQQGTAAKARSAAADATAPASRGAKKAASKADDATSAAKEGADKATGAAAEATTGAVQAGAEKLEAGRRAVVAASGQVASTARTAWTVISQRKLVAVAAGAGLTAVSAASYAVGRRAGRPAQGPLTRLTGGRI
ncbi:hypothetical protein [Streptomyces sp. NPDC001843]|uniref:hypothetical protein n=1 Tax=Streptomyces sp. NPDC001843 TaxID=3364617 RepID=UPI0036B3B37B